MLSIVPVSPGYERKITGGQIGRRTCPRRPYSPSPSSSATRSSRRDRVAADSLSTADMQNRSLKPVLMISPEAGGCFEVRAARL
jgi:hypothetical protein